MIGKKVSTLVTSVPRNGKVEGIVITSCGKCNLDTKDRGCQLTVKIGSDIFSVDGSNVHEHGDAHSNTGLCSAVRVAWAKGRIKKSTFFADSFVLVGE